MSNILKFFRKIHHTTPAFSKEDLNDDKDNGYSKGKVLQNHLNRRSSADTNCEQTQFSSSQNRINSDKKVKLKKRKNHLDPPSNSSSDSEVKTSFRAKLFVSPNINRFKRFHSLNNENLQQFQSETVATDSKNISNNFIFERVKVKKNTRYLRHSPDRSSFESMSPTITPSHSFKNQQFSETACNEADGTHFTKNNDIYAIDWSTNNSSALRLWDVNKNSLEDINNNNWDDDFEIHMRSSVSPMLSSISSSSTMYTWVDDEITSKSLYSNDWHDDTDKDN